MRILVLGGYGLFGSRIVEALADDAGLTVLVAGRDSAKAEALVATLTTPSATLESIAIDARADDFAERLAALCPDIVIDSAGPFQARDYRVAEAVLAAGAHCIDLADSRGFAAGIGALDERARAAHRWVISGASSVPGLHAAVIEAHRHRFAALESVDTAIVPGNRTPRGWATTQAILSYVGKPFRVRSGGAWATAHGWQSLRRRRVEGIGTRWMARCDVPDLELLPARYPELRTVDFRAGLELRRMHFGLWLGALAVRLGIVRSLLPWAKPLFALSERWQDAGSDVGLMQVRMRGRGHDGARLATEWTLVARAGDGPRIPAAASVVLVRKLARGELPGGGAKPCLDLFTLREFMAALEGHAIEATTRETRG